MNCLQLTVFAFLGLSAKASVNYVDENDLGVIDGYEEERLLWNEGIERNLEAEYVEPVWWKEYRKHYGKYVKRCKFIEPGAEPVDGESCPPMRVGDYACLFGEHECADGKLHPERKCDCFAGVWKCHDFEACDKGPELEECPVDHPISYNTPLSCKGDMKCPIGEETCCGGEFPKYSCECRKGKFNCWNYNSCADAKCPEEGDCPNTDTDTPPEFGSECEVEAGKQCHYQKRCCCGKCSKTKISCECLGVGDNKLGKWVCDDDDFKCPDTCLPDIHEKHCATAEVVQEGEVECCDGTTRPVWECSCNNHLWFCELMNAPFMECPQCG